MVIGLFGLLKVHTKVRLFCLVNLHILKIFTISTGVERKTLAKKNSSASSFEKLLFMGM